MLASFSTCAVPQTVEQQQASSWARSLSAYSEARASSSSSSCLVTAARDLASPLRLDGNSRRGRCAPIAEAPHYCSGVAHAVPYWGDPRRVGQIDHAVARCVAKYETAASPTCARLARSFLCATRFPRCVVGSDAVVHAGCAQLCEQLQAHACPGADELSCSAAPRCSMARPERWQGCYDDAPSCTSYDDHVALARAPLPPRILLLTPPPPPPSPPSEPVPAAATRTEAAAARSPPPPLLLPPPPPEAAAARAVAMATRAVIALDALPEIDAHDDEATPWATQLDSRVPPEGPGVVSPSALGAGWGGMLYGGGASNATRMPMVFFLGPGKTGTETLSTLLTLLGDRPCHNFCDGAHWWAVRDAAAATWRAHRSFMDNGHEAPFRWLDGHFGDARFVLNTRPLHDLMLSRYDQTVEVRLNAGCSAEGSKLDCDHGVLSNCSGGGFDGSGCEVPMVDNDVGSMRAFVQRVARSQQDIADYFTTFAPIERRRRFIQMSVTGASYEETLARLFWTIRPDTAVDADIDPFVTPFPLLEPYLQVARAAVPLSEPHENSRPHSAQSAARVQEILASIGCGECGTNLLYGQCRGCPELGASATPPVALAALPRASAAGAATAPDANTSATQLPFRVERASRAPRAPRGTVLKMETSERPK